MCKYCASSESLFFRQWDPKENLDRFELYIDGDGIMTIDHVNFYTGENDGIDIKINYCPMCGRKFKKGDDSK